jgi:hypothetical protein
MTVDTLLSCYICGETSDRATVDLIGCFRDQEAAAERFNEKHDSPADGYIDICPDCRENNPNHAKNAEEKYGVYT